MSNVAFLLGERASIILSENERNRRAYNGQLEPFLLLKVLANNNPQNNYIVIDEVAYLQRYTIEMYNKDFPHGNVYFPVNEFAKRIKKDKEAIFERDTLNEKAQKILDEMMIYLKSFNIEYGISFCTYNYQGVPGVSRKTRNPNEFCKLRVCDARAKYGIYFLNQTKLPYITYTVDMRFIKGSGTLLIPPKAIIGFDNKMLTLTFNKDNTIESIKKCETIDYDVPMVYASTDTLMITKFDKEDLDNNYMKNKKLITFLNQQAGGLDRMKFLEDFGLFEKFTPNELDIYANYGKTNKTDKDYNLNGHVTKDTVGHKEMIELMKESKYTLIVPTYDGLTPMSAKPWENMYTQTIPFMVRNKYGADYWREEHTIPNFFFVSDAKELKEKIEILEKAPLTYDRILEYFKIILERKVTGEELNEKINNIINTYIKGEK